MLWLTAIPVMTWCQRPRSASSSWRACALSCGLPRISPFSNTVVSAVITRRSAASGNLSASAALCFASHGASSSARPRKRFCAVSSSTGGVHTVYGKPSSWNICLRRGEAEASNRGRGVVIISLYAPMSLHIQYARSGETYPVVVPTANGRWDEDGTVYSSRARGWRVHMKHTQSCPQGVAQVRRVQPAGIQLAGDQSPVRRCDLPRLAAVLPLSL